MPSEPAVVALAIRQLVAYNASDIDAFCACYHPDVTILDADGRTASTGIAAFRERYARMFATHRDVVGVVSARVHVGTHVVEHESWSRVEIATGVEHRGEVLVRYTEQDGLIRWVQFFRG